MNADILALSCSKVLTPAVVFPLAEEAGSADLFRFYDSDALNLYVRKIPGKRRMTFEGKDVLREEAARIADECRKKNIRIITCDSDGYPDRLKQIYRYPLVLYVMGDENGIIRDPSFLKTNPYCRTNVSIVGTRRPHQVSIRFAETLGRKVADSGGTMISGLAKGIDAYAHRGALKGGRTVAVLGSGVDIKYPWANRHLFDRILKEGGAIVSEYPPGMQPKRYTFPQRNRIISGLSDHVVMVQAPQKSGALITVSYATDQNRDVFVFDGPAHESFKGNHRLIKEGALKIKTSTEFMNLAGFDQKGGITDSSHSVYDVNHHNVSSAHRKIINFCLNSPRSAADVAEHTGQSETALNAHLMKLLLRGILTADAGGRYVAFPV